MELNTTVYENAEAENVDIYEKLEIEGSNICSKTNVAKKNNPFSLAGVNTTVVKTSRCIKILLIANFILVGACLAISIAGFAIPLLYPNQNTATDPTSLEELAKKSVRKTDEDFKTLNETIFQYIEGKL